jgi:hypothetical protein
MALLAIYELSLRLDSNTHRNGGWACLLSLDGAIGRYTFRLKSVYQHQHVPPMLCVCFVRQTDPKTPQRTEIKGAALRIDCNRVGARKPGFPAMAGNVPFLMKDIVLLAVSIYLLKQDVERVLEAGARTNVTLSQA